VNWFDAGSVFLRTLPFAAYIEPADDVFIARIDPNFPRFRDLLMLIRRCILKLSKMQYEKAQKIVIGAKPKRAASVRCQLTVPAVTGWLDMWSMLNVVDSLTMDSALTHIVRRQELVLQTVARLRAEGFFDPANYSDTFFSSTTRRTQTDLSDFTILPIFAVYENATNATIRDKIETICQMRARCNNTNTVYGVKYSDEFAQPTAEPARNGPLCCIILQESFWYDEVVRGIIKVAQTGMTNQMNQLMPGMYIRCRENARSLGVYNNQTAIFLTFYIKEMWRFEYVRESTYNFIGQAAVASSYIRGGGGAKRAAKKLAVATEEGACLTKIKLRGSSDADFQAAARSIYMVAFDLETRKIICVNPTVKYLCENCERGDCAHHRASTNKVRFLCFNWTPHYSSTIFNLQGSTVDNDYLFLVSEHVFRTNLARTLNVLISRARSPRQIIVDPLFIKQCIRIIFGTPLVDVENFLTRHKLEVKSNTTVADILDNISSSTTLIN
jgi:hypothetical protein